MPAAAAAIAVSALASGAAAFAVGGSFLAAFAGSMVLGAISYALTPKPKKPAVPEIQGSNVAVRQPDLTRLHVYGHTRVTRGYAHMQATGSNGSMYLILMLCEGPVRAINEIWVNDYCIPDEWINPSTGEVTEGRYAGQMIIKKHLGGENQQADDYAVFRMSPSWTNEHRLQGVAYIFFHLAKNQDKYFMNGIPNLSAVVEGPTVYDPRVGEQVWTTNIALLAHDFIRNERYGFGAPEEDLDIANISAQANICDEIVDTETESFSINDVDTSRDVVEIEGDILTLQFGDRVKITGSPPGGLSTETDYYVIPYQIKETPRIGFATSLQNAMDKTFINLSSAGGNASVVKTGEPRYHGSGLIDTETALSETLNNIASSMAGRIVNIGGFWSMLAGAWRTPTIELGIGDVRGNGIVFKNSLSMAESFNEVKGLFISPVSYYQPTDYPSAVYQSFIEDDNGIKSTKDLNLPFTTRPTTAQRIAKIELFRGRQQIAVQAMFSLKSMQLQPGDTVYLDIERYGWDSKVFEVTDFTLDIADGAIVTKLSLRETAQQIYDWSQGEAIEYDPAPNTNLTNPFNVDVPNGVSYNSRVADTTAGDTLYIMQLQWEPHEDAFVREFGDFELQFKKSVNESWLPSFFVDGKLTESDLFTSEIGTPYDLRIRARNSFGVRSNWVTIPGAIVGSSGGVTELDDWETFSDAVVETEDWETFSDAVVETEDWGYFT